MNLARLIHIHAENKPRQPALIEGLDRSSLTFGELDDRAARTARHLGALGVGGGDRIGVCLRDELQTVIIALALWRVNAIWLPMDYRWTAAEQMGVCRAFGPRIVIVEPGRRAVPDWDIVHNDKAWTDAATQASPLQDFGPGGDAPILIALTSGTTGAPKGYVYSHRGYYAMCLNYWLDAGIEPHHCCLSPLPIAFAAGRGLLMSSLLRGATVVQIPAMSRPEEILDVVERHRVNVTCMVPSMLRGLVAHSEAVDPGRWPLLKGLDVLISIGARLHPGDAHLVRERLSANIVDFYGSTGGGITTVLKGDDLDSKAGSVGRAAHAVEIEIVDQQHRPLARGESGRVRCRTPGMALGCYGDSPGEDDDETFREGWHYPGDYGYLDTEGYLYLQGRLSEIIIRGGINVFAPEVERILTMHPDVSDAVVIGVTDARYDQDIVAFVVADKVRDRDLSAHCRTHLAPYKVPSRFMTLPELPRSNAGKVLKRDLYALLERDRNA